MLMVATASGFPCSLRIGAKIAPNVSVGVETILQNWGNIGFSDEVQMMHRLMFMTTVIWSNSHISDGFILHFIGLLTPPGTLTWPRPGMASLAALPVRAGLLVWCLFVLWKKKFSVTVPQIFYNLTKIYSSFKFLKFNQYKRESVLLTYAPLYWRDFWKKKKL